MSVQTEKFIRKVRPVEAVKVTEDNLNDVEKWCGGLVVPAGSIGDNKETYIHVPVRNPRRDSDSQAFVGMWIIKEDFRNCRVVTNKQFRNSYDPLEKAKSPVVKPSSMPQKKTEPTQVGAVEVVPGTPADEGSSLTTGTKEHHVNRDASTGEFVTDEVAEANPDTTVTETIEDNNEEENVQDESFNHDALGENELDTVVPGDMVDLEQAEEDEDGTVQLGAPIESTIEDDIDERSGLCGSCGSVTVDGVCSNDTSHDVNGSAVEAGSAPRILPGN